MNLDKVKGSVVTVKDISKPEIEVKETHSKSIQYDVSEFCPKEFTKQVVVLELPIEYYDEIKDKDSYINFCTKSFPVIDYDAIEHELEPIPNVIKKTKYNVLFLGLKKMEVRSE